MAFAIYIASVPGDTTLQDEKLAKVGLSHLQAGASYIATPAGPDGKSGVVFSWYAQGDHRGPMAYLPDHQEWTPSIQPGLFWLGFRRNEKPTPDLLAFGDNPGLKIVLGDGQEWVLPAAGSFPADIEIGDELEPVYSLQDEFVALAGQSQQWCDWMAANGDSERPMSIPASVLDYLGSMLALNYKVFPELIERLGLFNGETIPRALLAATHGVEATEIDLETEQAVLNV